MARAPPRLQPAISRLRDICEIQPRGARKIPRNRQEGGGGIVRQREELARAVDLAISANHRDEEARKLTPGNLKSLPDAFDVLLDARGEGEN